MPRIEFAGYFLEFRHPPVWSVDHCMHPGRTPQKAYDDQFLPNLGIRDPGDRAMLARGLRLQ
jgi:hypothetical protein